MTRLAGGSGASDTAAENGGAGAAVSDASAEANGATARVPDLSAAVRAGASASDATAEDGGDVTGARSGIVGLVMVLVLWVYVAVRLYALTTDPDLRPWYVAGLAAFLVIQLVVLLRRDLSVGLLHLALAAQSATVLVLFTLEPERDFVTALFVSLCYQAATVFAGRTRLVWVAGLVSLNGASLVTELGPLRGLSLALSPMAAGVVLATYVVVSRELEAGRAASQRMVGDLQVAQRQLELYARQAEELATIEARSRVARELDGSVSRTLSDVLAVARSAQPVLDHPDDVGPRIERLQTLTQEALAQMRRIIAELRPSSVDTAEEP